MFKALKYFIPVFILAIGGILAYVLISTKPAPRQRSFPHRTPRVEVCKLEESSFDVKLNSQGVVQARTEINLTSEVRGKIIEISPYFRVGGFFEKGDVLARLDPFDYESDLTVAKAALAQAELTLAQEEARYEQAKADWERMDVAEKPSSLVLREPQIKQAKANIASTQARVRSAERNIERTIIKAPFAGRILSKSVDVGQYVSPGNPLAQIYAVDYAEVRLPLTANQLTFLNMKEVYRGESPDLKNGPVVQLRSRVAEKEFIWTGRIVRSEGAIDSASRQLFVIAQIKNPYGRIEEGKPPLKVGTFVEAVIDGKTLDSVYIVPRKFLNETEWVLVVDGNNMLRRRIVDVIWHAGEMIIVRSGFQKGDRLCLTNVPYSLEGMIVEATEITLDEHLNPVQEEKVNEPPKRRNPSGPGGFVEAMLKAIPKEKKIPDSLRTQLDKAIESGDRQQIRPAIESLRKWAKSEGIELPAGQGRG